ncbi:hypothetical protein FRC03_001388 [Tulasnella sp. 419]|nr:hypothetical protein FRC03_001388 [Tulasnella sp. 419]
MFAVADFIRFVSLILSILAVDGTQGHEINVFMVFVMMAMAILKGIYMSAGVLANQIHSFVYTSWKSLEAVLLRIVNSLFNTPPQPKTPPTPRIRRVRLSNEVKQETSPPKTRSQCLFEALAKARAQPKIASTPPTTPQVTYQPAIRRVAFSSWVEVQEYHLREAPKRIQADRRRAGLGYMLGSGKIHRL